MEQDVSTNPRQPAAWFDRSHDEGSMKVESGSIKTSFDGPALAASPFDRLPSKVIERILYIVDANTFASLALLNCQWRKVSDSPQLYAHHLSLCPLFSTMRDAISGRANWSSLPVLKRKFTSETRRSVFDVFLRPRRTSIELMSISTGSATALPQGEAFQFSFSTNGQTLLCLSSSRIVVLDLASPKVTVKHELKTLRKPLAAAILDDGQLLAVVSSMHQVNIYRLLSDEAKHIQTITVDNIPRTIALSPTGSVLAIAYEGGIEVFTLGEDVITTQRRAVRCVTVDSVTFSPDGALLLGSSVDVNRTGVVIIAAPLYTDIGDAVASCDVQAQAWTTQILFPEVILGLSHVALLPLRAEDGYWTIGFEGDIQAFRAVNINDRRTGTTYFISPELGHGSRGASRPMAIPAPHRNGELVALTFQGCGLWLYGLPGRFDLTPSMQNGLLGPNISSNPGNCPRDSITGYETSSQRLQRITNESSLPISGHKVADIPGISATRWIVQRQSDDHNYIGHYRLVAVAPGGVPSSSLGEEVIPVDGGRVIVFDFERSARNGESIETTVVVGEVVPKLLKEHNANLDVEVELERRRARLHRGEVGQPRNVVHDPSRSATRPVTTTEINRTHTLTLNPVISGESPTNSLPDVGQNENALLDAPYSNTQPRSRDSLYRAASAAVATHGRYNPRYRHSVNLSPLECQIQGESDTGNWIPPPPPYTPDAEIPLPEEFSRILVPTLTEPPRRVGNIPSVVRRAQTDHLGTLQNPMQRSRSTVRKLNAFSGSSHRWTIRDLSSNEDSTSAREHRNLLRRRRATNATDTTSAIIAPQTNSTYFSLQPLARVVQPGTPSMFTAQSFAAPSVQGRTGVPVSPRPRSRDLQPPVPPISTISRIAVPERASETYQISFAPRASLGLDRSLSHASSRTFSISARDLRLRDAEVERLETIQSAGYLSGGSEMVHSPLDDVGGPLRLTSENLQAAANQSISSSPVVPAPQQNIETHDWRRRIEQWNLQTIKERKKKARLKCLVM